MSILWAGDESDAGESDKSYVSVQWDRLRSWYIAHRDQRRHLKFLRRHGTTLDVWRHVVKTPIQKARSSPRA